MAVAPWIVSDKLWNRHDVTQLIPLLEAVPAGPRDRARVRPLQVGRRAHLCLATQLQAPPRPLTNDGTRCTRRSSDSPAASSATDGSGAHSEMSS